MHTRGAAGSRTQKKPPRLLSEAIFLKKRLKLHFYWHVFTKRGGVILIIVYLCNHVLPKDVFARIEALEAQFAAKQQEFKEKYL